MSQSTTGLYAILSHPFVYSLFQSLMAAHRYRTRFVEEYVRPFPGCSILDIGCGPADIFPYLSDTDYWGIDISPSYIAQARKRFGSKGRFECRFLTQADMERMPRFDRVLAMGLLHHLNDTAVIRFLQLAHKLLKPGGRLITFDPCRMIGQNLLARFFIRTDRGRNIRTQKGYADIVRAVFDSPRIEVRTRSLIPCTDIFMECTRQ